MRVDLVQASAAVQALGMYRKMVDSGRGLYGHGEYLQFELQDYEISDVIASLLHLAEQLRNEGKAIDPKLVWERAWMHFDAEVLHPDDIEEDRRRIEEG